MQNYKVEVQNHSEVMEAQDLFLKMGFRKELFSYSGYPKLVVTSIDSIGGYSSGAEIGYLDADKITLPELRAMVVLKKNDIGDATHENTVTGSKVYVGANSKYYFQDGIWNEYPCGVDIKPIQKEELKMKEYLVKTNIGYVFQVLSDVVDGHGGIIEVPEGSNVAWKDNSNGFVFFTKMEMGYRDATIIWNRESLNDQAASAEEYRKSFTHTPKATLDLINNIQNAFEKAQNAINVQNAMAKLFTYPQYLSGVAHGKEFIVKPNQKSGGADHGVEQTQTREISECDLIDSGKLIIGGLGESFPVGLEHHKFTQPEELPFVGDTQQTLNERQSQYGDFKDVAEMTQGLLFVMEQYGYKDMPDMHKEALHMICSKMARIVNGDHNHLDSWHDIGGYAKLIENNIK